MIDEVVHYINKVRQRIATGDQLNLDGVLSTISALASAVSTCPKAVLLITSPEDAHALLSEHGIAGEGDAFRADALELLDMLKRIDSQLARQIRPVVPSGQSDLPAILRARLFQNIDDEARRQTAASYAAVASRNSRSNGTMREESFKEAYPFHPSVMTLITGRLAANLNFQRVRGTLRLLANTVLNLSNQQDDTPLLHAHHIDPGSPAVREELVNRTGFEALDPAIDTDVIGPNSTAAKIGDDLSTRAAKTLLIGTLAPDNVNGLYVDQIADAILSPQQDDFGVVTAAVHTFLTQAIHVDDNAESNRQRFSSEPNVMKQLIETRDSIRNDTQRMETLLRTAINSAYSGGNRQGSQMPITIFPHPLSNVPDNPEQVHLGIVNPEFFNWTDAQDSTMQMSNSDLLNLYSHNMANNGTEPRQNRNNTFLLVPHNKDLESIRNAIATMEAAERLLDDPNQALQEHRKDTLKAIRAESEKNATTGIQNKWTHLICPGTSDTHRWPSQASTLEHRALSSTAEPAGNVKKQILDQLGDRILHGNGANISPNAWAQIPILRKQEGTTLRELREYFSRTPAERSVLNNQLWMNLVRTGIHNGGLYVETPTGEVNPPQGYAPDWLAWATPYKPVKVAPAPTLDPGPIPVPGPRPDLSIFNKPKFIQTEFTHAGVAATAVKNFMQAQGYTWETMQTCTIRANAPEFADHVASIPQGGGEGITITLAADDQTFNLELREMNPIDFKRFYGAARRILQLAEVETADVTVKAEPKRAEEILNKLNNNHIASITAHFD